MDLDEPASPTVLDNVDTNAPLEMEAPLEDGKLAVPTGMSREAMNNVLYSDIGIEVLLKRLKQSIASARDFANFLKKRSSLEEEHAMGLKKLNRSTHENNARTESRQGSYASQFNDVIKVHERLADNGLQFSTAIFNMHDEINELATNIERNRKHWKGEGLSNEKKVKDAESAMEKAKSKYESSAENYDRARTGDSSGRVFGLKGPKSAEQREEDLHRKVQTADSDYAAKVTAAHDARQENQNTLRPKAIDALQQLIRECDSGLTMQLQKFAALNEKLLVGNGLAVSPMKPNEQDVGPPSLRDMVSGIDNERDLYTFVTAHTNSVPSRPNEIKYQKHPAMGGVAPSAPVTQYAMKPVAPKEAAAAAASGNISGPVSGTVTSASAPNSAMPLSAGPMSAGAVSTGATSALSSHPPSAAAQSPSSPSPVTMHAPPSALQAPPSGQSSNTWRTQPAGGQTPQYPPSAAPDARPSSAGLHSGDQKVPIISNPMVPTKNSNAGLAPTTPQAAASPVAAVNGSGMAPNQPSQPATVGRPQRGPGGTMLPAWKPVFGMDLEALFRRDEAAVPYIVHQCILAIDMFGLEVEGLYRLNGSTTHIQQLRALFDHDSAGVDFRNPETFFHDVNSVAGLLKQFFRELPDPLFTREHYQEFIEGARIEDPTARRDSLHATINALPDPNYASLRALVMHLYRVQEHSNTNRMNIQNLAICWAPSLFGQTFGEGQDTALQPRIVETIVQNTYQIFDED